MSDTLTEQSNNPPTTPPTPKRRHPYFMENSREETLRRMETFPERAAKFLEKLEKLNADRKTDAS